MTLPSPRHVLELVRKERRQLLRDPRTRLIMFVAPIVQLLMFGYAVNTDIHDTATFVVDRDLSAASRALVRAFETTGRFAVVGGSQRPADLERALDRGTATVALGYAQRVVGAFAREWADGAPPSAIDLRARAWYNPGLESRLYNVPAVIGVVLLLMCLLLTALAVAREREVGTLEQLMVTPLTPAELMLGKTIPVAVVGVIDLALVTAVAVFWFDVPLRGSIVALLAASIVYILGGLAVGLLISTLSRTQQEAFMTMFLFILPAVILAGFLYPVRTMPAFFRGLAELDPVRHFLVIVRGVFLKGDGIADLWSRYLILTAMALAMLGFAVQRFRRSIT